MTYGSQYIDAVEAWTALAYDNDDIALDADSTACMTNGTAAEDCDEWKEGVLNLRLQMNMGVPVSALSTFKAKFYFNSLMTLGSNAMLPYTDSNSVSTTNEVIQIYDTPGSWIEHVASDAFIAELGDLGGNDWAVRLSANDGAAKSKLGEVEVDLTFETVPISGVTMDKDGGTLGSCTVVLFNQSAGNYSQTEKKISDPTTGSFAFDVGSGVSHMIYSIKEDSPHIFDATDNVVEGDTS